MNSYSRIFRACIGLFVGMSVPVSLMPAQALPPTIEITDSPSCARCIISVTPTLKVGDGDGGDGSLPRMPSQAIQNRQGRIFVTLYAPPALAYMFDSTGRFLKRIGRIGAGPGEYRSAFLVRGTQDSIVILDPFNARRSILSPDGALVRSAPMSVPSPVALEMKGGQQLVSSPSGFSLVSNEGKLLRSVGPQKKAVPASTIPNVSKSRSDNFWTYDAATYTFVRLSLVGGQELVIKRNGNVFPQAEKRSAGADGTRPTPELQEIYEDSAGVVWSIVHVASADWSKWLGPKSERVDVLPYQKTRKDKLYDSVIEAFDVNAGQLIQSVRLKGYFSHFLRDNVVAQHVEDDDGYSYLQLHRIQLRRR